MQTLVLTDAKTYAHYMATSDGGISALRDALLAQGFRDVQVAHYRQNYPLFFELEENRDIAVAVLDAHAVTDTIDPTLAQAATLFKSINMPVLALANPDEISSSMIVQAGIQEIMMVNDDPAAIAAHARSLANRGTVPAAVPNPAL